MLKKFLLAIVAGLCSVSINAQVQININGVDYHFEQSPRLDSVLDPIALEKPWYWPASKLFRLDADIPNEKKQQLLQAMSQLEGSSSDLKVALPRLRREIESWTLLTRVEVGIDFELARLQKSSNPKFESGSYQLHLQERPQTLLFFGAVKETTVSYRDASDLGTYLDQLSLSEEAAKDRVITIAPNGNVTVVPTYSSVSQFEPAPGSMVLIPFKNDADSRVNDLNDLLLQLSIHRVF